MKSELIEKAYAAAKARYAEQGIDTENVLETLQHTPITLRCLQDARAEESRRDIDKLRSLLGGVCIVSADETGWGNSGISFAKYAISLRTQQKNLLRERLVTDFEMQETDERSGRLLELGSAVDAVYNHFNFTNGVPVDEDFVLEAENYEKSNT
ncbi:MAG: L-rhamnose isomerase [Bacteroidales bacterium]|nr:L-rhamnose isomerase [Bacteroidales bacterium]